MVLESLVSPVEAEKRPLQMLILGFIYASIAMFLSLWIFYEYSSLVMVFLTVFASVPIVYNTIKLEEKKDESETSEGMLLKEHARALEVFIFLFLGFSLAYALWFVFAVKIIVAFNFIAAMISKVLPFVDFHIDPEHTRQTLFTTQIDTFNSINTKAVGFAATLGKFTEILSNNMRVLVFCIMFSFIYGLGAIFILAWNASVIGAAIGLYIQQRLAELTATGITGAATIMQIFMYGFLRYSLHGILEIFAYFVGGLAGGIISVAVIRHNFGTRKFEKILWDSSYLILISMGVLVVAAFVEVWITPLIF